jgi:hypothetical protein
MAEILDEFDEPGAVTAGLDPDDHLADEGAVKSAGVIPFVVELGGAYLAADRVAVTNRVVLKK